MTPSPRCTREELPDLPVSWAWEELDGSGWIAEGASGITVVTNLVGDEGVHVCAHCSSDPAYAPLVVILAVAMANGIDIIMVAKDVAES